MDVEQLIEKMREDYPNYTISISEQENYRSVAIRVSADNNSVSVIKNDSHLLEEVMQEAIDRLECLISGEEYGVVQDPIEVAIRFFRLTLQELSFDKAVSLLEKLDRR